MQVDPRIKSYDAQLDGQQLQKQTNPIIQEQQQQQNSTKQHSGTMTYRILVPAAAKNKQHASLGLSDDAV